MSLPPEIWREIFRFLGKSCRICPRYLKRVCTQWRDMIDCFIQIHDRDIIAVAHTWKSDHLEQAISQLRWPMKVSRVDEMLRILYAELSRSECFTKCKCSRGWNVSVYARDIAKTIIALKRYRASLDARWNGSERRTRRKRKSRKSQEYKKRLIARATGECPLCGS
jgi:hypothetical protein